MGSKLWMIVVFLAGLAKSAESTCYFAQEFQGEYVMQGSVSSGSGILYSALNITENSIPIWGSCHKRSGNNFIFMDNVSETSCIRCLHLKLRSANILQVFAKSQEYLSKCFTNEESALASCPSEESILRREAAEILLFKTKLGRMDTPNKDFCPIDGKYFVNYEKTNSPIQSECRGYNSTVDSCPSGSTLTFRLKGCTFDSYELTFDCLGHWQGMNGEAFLVFVDHRYRDGHNKPKYRCAMYKEDPRTGKIQMALGKDSTCITELDNSTSGHEKFLLTPYKQQWPAEASDMCTFPKWMQGNWEHVRVTGDTMVYKDHSSFKTLTIKCVGVQDSGDRFVIYTRTQCNVESYNCMRIANRSVNILEFQIGTNASSIDNVYSLCSDQNFAAESWITQGKLDVKPQTAPGMCPILGEYTGQLPDNGALCGKMWSDCRAPELMYYQVVNCVTNETYEDREYRCLGHWRESEMLYTYTQRNDVAAGTYECFVGRMSDENEIYIKEAGEHCQRDVDARKFGMKLKKTETYTCKSRETTRRPSIGLSTTPPTKPTFTTKRKTPTTYFDNIIPKSSDDEASSGHTVRTCTALYIILYITKLFV